MPDAHVKKGKVSFQTEGRLLQELGERLVAKADVALMELIKNAYDADASECRVKFDGERVEVSDDGHGMTEDEFIQNWMHIATPDKQRRRQSRRYKRTVTGSKGIGRFAVRFLGRKLSLETVAEESSVGGKKMLLRISFDWGKIDAASDLRTVEIPYELGEAPPDRDTGTRLVIEKLRNPEDIKFSKDNRTELLSIIDPYSGLDTAGFGRQRNSDVDPGFKVVLPEGEGEGEEDLVGAVLTNAYARLTIEHKNDKVSFLIRNKDGKTLLQRTATCSSHISKGFFADIRYCPRRAGVFRNTPVDGRFISGWLKKHGGIGIVDHGFRIRPYGFADDDWLNLSFDSAHNRREWRTALMNRLYPMSDEAKSQPKLNPMLYLPGFHQMVGAVFVESSQDLGSERPTDLTPSMDREGFVVNEAFRELYDLVRAGLEMLAFADHREQRRIEEKKKQEETQVLREDLREAAAYIETVPGLSAHDREAVVTHFTTLSKQLDEVKEYYQVSTSRLEMMGLLGVMAGFVTHEMQRILNGLDRLLERLRRDAARDKEIGTMISEIEETRDAIVGQLDYSTSFIGSLHDSQSKPEPISARGAIRLIVRQFQRFTQTRRIQVDVDIDEDVMSPPLPRALYNGVALNLYTNALKAAVGGIEADPNPKVVVKAWNEPKRHVLEVADTGVGIPPTLRERIWDPLFTTTSAQDYNPLGSGMGLGLTLVKKIVSDAGGSVGLVSPPPGFKTCFRVEFKRKEEKQ
jgi:signal transduction histidine kinase